ncbi:MAG: sugar phosphate isomerase/epimerase [Balneolales bacterium]
MSKHKIHKEYGKLSRRHFINTASVMTAGSAFFGYEGAIKAPSLLTKPKLSETIINGVEIGLIVPYALRGLSNDSVDILNILVDLGIGSVEMQNPPVEKFAGIPEKDQAQWRATVSMDKFKNLRKLYNESGVQFYAYKHALSENMTDNEYDYVFNVAKALGAKQVTMELPSDVDGRLTDRIGQFAEKHQIMVAYHNHARVNINFWDRAIWQSKYNGINLDIGHYVAGTNESPISLIERHWDRIGSLHLKDRKLNEGENCVWGEGDTPLVEVLQLMRDRKASFQATIELEYSIPDGSDPLREINRCFEYCRKALNS